MESTPKLKYFLDEYAYPPTRAHPTDAGLDLYSRDSVVIAPHSSYSFDTGVHVCLPPDTVGLLKSKSGLNVKQNITSTGVIDEGYTGSIVVKLYNNGDTDQLILAGQKISQLLVLPVLYPDLIWCSDVEELGHTERGADGFGSTGK